MMVQSNGALVRLRLDRAMPPLRKGGQHLENQDHWKKSHNLPKSMENYCRQAMQNRESLHCHSDQSDLCQDRIHYNQIATPGEADVADPPGNSLVLPGAAYNF